MSDAPYAEAQHDVPDPHRLSPPPPPPPPPADVAGASTHDGVIGAPKVGELTAGWHWVVRIAWLGVFIGLSSVWKASRDIGLPTWWIGPLGDPRPFYITLLPFVAPTAMVMMTFSRGRAMPWMGLAASAITAVIAVFDLSPYPGLGVVELVLALSGAAVSVASFGGRFRAVSESPQSAPATAAEVGATR